MRFMLRKYFWAVFLLDLLLISLSFYLAHWLRFDGELTPVATAMFASTLAPLLAIKMMCFVFSDLYRGMWRYTGVKDLVNVIKASVCGSTVFVVYLAVFYHFHGFSRGVLLADGMLTIVFIGGARLAVRLYHQRDQGFFDELIFWRQTREEGTKVLIVGTGPLAE
ncbi:MAG TPA: hypothetical protein PK545_02790, partial [Deltaproteobacteria bacterium]|nr:hypothetical protein [Deltaproteobacteria bacterium]